MYKRMREIVKGIVNHTREINSEELEGNYLKSFKNRRLSQLIEL